jgi:hypothetical protein
VEKRAPGCQDGVVKDLRDGKVLRETTATLLVGFFAENQ